MNHPNGIQVLVVACILGLVLLSSCSKDHDVISYENPIDKGNVVTPPVPHSLVAQVADRSIALTWAVDDSSDVRWYRIARKDSLSGEFEEIDSTSVRRYEDRRLKNGRAYRYRVCVVNRSGFVGAYSHEVTAVPSGFTIVVNNDEEFTNTPRVNLTISASGGASFIMLANDSFFNGASWEPYSSQKSWQLTNGDGSKVVFMKIRDLDDNESAETYQDDIILDTKASIASVEFSPQGSVLSPGDQIHFSMDTGESEGQASVSIGTAAMGKSLYDDGTQGDMTANDGYYELDYVIPGNLEVVEAVVTGHFTDQAGNNAEEVTSVKTLTIQSSPQPVQLFPPTTLEDLARSLHLTWSQNQDADFKAYRLYRSDDPGVQDDPDRILVADITSQSTTWHDDTDLEENTAYYYQIYVYDNFGLYSPSNEVSATTGENQEPEPVTLLITTVHIMPDDSTTAQIELKWTRSQEGDFDHYILYRDTQSPVTTSSAPVDLINEAQITTTTDDNLQFSTQYFYRLYVCDEDGLCAGSNEVNATTPPAP
jgi:fibronectin type 3 domain-containing protein